MRVFYALIGGVRLVLRCNKLLYMWYEEITTAVRIAEQNNHHFPMEIYCKIQHETSDANEENPRAALSSLGNFQGQASAKAGDTRATIPGARTKQNANSTNFQTFAAVLIATQGITCRSL